jgi:hypothetical protein
LKSLFKKFVICLGVTCLLNFQAKTFAVALLGPIQPWMQITNGAIAWDDIGGPMEIGSEYRWNVPVVTYGFDQSFLDFFGTNGVAAVESAIKILNDLPPASSLALTNYPLVSGQMNYTALSLSLLDLKSTTLSLLLEQLGLAQPTHSTFILKQRTPLFAQYAYADGFSPYDLLFSFYWDTWAIPDFISQLNYDPASLTVSPYVNNVLYSAFIFNWSRLDYGLQVFQIDPYANSYTAVADHTLVAGRFYPGLTYDDVGGLAYLLSTNNLNYETLLPGIFASGANPNSFVNGAWRPGIDKISFVAQPVNSVSGNYLPLTNQFTDTYFTNASSHQQQLVRVVSQPDFLFSAGDVVPNSIGLPFYWRTGTTNWLNNFAANGNTNGTGPGVIQSHVQIIFNKLGRLFEAYADEQPYDYTQSWASFDNSTNLPVIYPASQTGTNQLTVRMWLMMGTHPKNFTRSFEWKPNSAVGDQFTLQTSTNLKAWINLFTVPNDGSVCTYFNYFPPGMNRFYRLVPQ